MKTTNYLLNLILIATLALAVSCKKDNSIAPSFSPDLITSGSWKVTSFHESQQDHTSDFTNHSFTFDSDGTLTADDSGIITIGSWSFDDSSNEIHLNIGTVTPLININKGWIILESTSTLLRLGDDSSNGEELDFTKI